MHKSRIYGCLVVALLFSQLSLAESAKIDDLEIEYAKRNLAPEELEHFLKTRIRHTGVALPGHFGP
ncbi:hypothetical protein, partial [Azorhizophilus paspali]